MIRLNRISKRKSNASRQAAATIELAICLPILVSIAFSTVEICSALYLKESLTIAAYEGSRVGKAAGGTNANAVARVFSILDERGIKYDRSSAVTISNPGFDTAGELTLVTVTVQVAAQENTISLTRLFFGTLIEARVVCAKEFKNA